MCLVMLSWQMSRQTPLIIAANRDERFDRPATPIDWWPDAPQIIAGRDQAAGGTWLGMTRSGRFGIITNFRDPIPQPAVRSRGELIPAWLQSDEDALAFQGWLEANESEFAGYNLLFGDDHGLHYFSNRSASAGPLTAGVYALSNAALNSDWPKVRRARDYMQQALDHGIADSEHFAAFLSDKTPARDDDLPQPYLPIEHRRVLSAPFIVGETYGTRCTTVVTRHADNTVHLHERHFAPLGERRDDYRLSFTIR